MTHVASAGWFILIALLAVLAFAVGRLVGKNAGLRAGVWIALAIVVLTLWTWLRFRPDIAVHMIPVRILANIESTAATPIYMLILGIAWARSRLARQRRVTLAAIFVGVFYFATGGMWMLQTTPQKGFAQTLRGPLVMQSQDFSCVPAACATALNKIHQPTTEAEMAELTQTRPGTGATVIRAMDGLSQRLEGSPWHVELVEADMTNLRSLPFPQLTALQFEASRCHMVVLTGFSKIGYEIADPVDGNIVLTPREFANVYGGQVIVFRR